MQDLDGLATGQTYLTDKVKITGEDIIAYATDFDPQPYHLDPVFAETSLFGGHCASGWHVCALTMRLLADVLKQNKIVINDASGVETLRWFKPVFAEDVLHASAEVSALRVNPVSASDAAADFLVNVINHQDEKVMHLSITCDISSGQNSDQSSDQSNSTGTGVKPSGANS